MVSLGQVQTKRALQICIIVLAIALPTVLLVAHSPSADAATAYYFDPSSGTSKQINALAITAQSSSDLSDTNGFDGWYFISSEVYSSSGISPLTVTGDVKLIILQNNTLQIIQSGASILINSGATLTIYNGASGAGATQSALVGKITTSGYVALSDNSTLNNYINISNGSVAVRILGSGCVVNNYYNISAISASSTAIGGLAATGNVNVTNYGTITGGINLSNYGNNVTFCAGSTITGSLNIGTGNSTLTIKDNSYKKTLLTASPVTVSGAGNTVNIGNKTANVEVDTSGSLSVGSPIILITGTSGGGVSGLPKNEFTDVGSSRLTFNVTSTQLTATTSLATLYYVDVDGEPKTYEDYTVITSTSFTSGQSVSLAGRYYVAGNVTLGTITMTNEVRFVLANGITMTANSITNPQVSDLCIYSQPADAIAMGKLVLAGSGISISGGSVTNTANITSIGSGGCITGPGKITNGVTGTIQNGTAGANGVVLGAGILDNYGMISAAGNGVAVTGGTVNNYAGSAGTPAGGWTPVVDYNGTIQGAANGILSDGGIIDNYGLIKGTGTGSSGINAVGTPEITNNAGGTIMGVNGIYLNNNTNGSVTNSGMITGSSGPGVFVIDGAASILNEEGGIIGGGTAGVEQDRNTAGCDVTNYGTISGNDGVIAGDGTTVTNYNSIKGESIGESSGVLLNGNSTLTNQGSIQGSWYGVSVTSTNNDVENDGTITGDSHYGLYSAGEKTHFSTNTLLNAAACTIAGPMGGIYFDLFSVGSTVDNYGTIKGTGAASFGIFAKEDINITNNEDSTISGGSYGLLLQTGTSTVVYGYVQNGSVVDNYGTIAGTTYGIFVPDGIVRELNSCAVTLVNYGLINGSVTLARGSNDVTFMVGSRINGDFTIGPNIASTLNFSGDLDDAAVPFTYSTVTGAADIGVAVVSVTFDTASGTLPAGYDGRDIVLIGGGTAKGLSANADPADTSNPRYSFDGYGFFIFARNDQLIATTDHKMTVTITGSGSVSAFDGSDGTTLLGSASDPEGYVLVPVTIVSVNLEAAPESGYFFRYFIIGGGDPSGVTPKTVAVNTDMNVEALFLGDVRTLKVTLSFEPAEAEADLSYTISGSGYTVTEEYTEPFFVGANETLSIAADADVYTFLRWDDGTRIISDAATTAPIDLSLYRITPRVAELTFTAKYALPSDVLNISLASMPSGADLYYAVDGLTEVNRGTTPFRVSKSESLAIRSYMSGYTFIRWDDGTKIISDAGPVATPALSDYAEKTTVTFTASFALPENVREVNLAADPVGPDLFYTIGALALEPFELPFYVSTNDIFTITAGGPLTGNTFLRWDDGSKIIASTATTAPINMSPYPLPPQIVTFTARYAATDSILTVTLASFPTGADLFYKIDGMTEVKYGTTPFILSKNESLTINSEWTGYTFIRWDDGTKIISDAGPVATLILSDYTERTAVTFTASFALPENVREVNLAADPVGPDLFYRIGTLAQEPFELPFYVSTNDIFTITAGDPLTGSTFLRWDDGSKIIASAAMTTPINMSPYPLPPQLVTFTARYASTDSILTVTLASFPTGASLSYNIGGLAWVQYGTTPFTVSKSESLTINSEWTGYTFLRWDDGTSILSDAGAEITPDLLGYEKSNVTFMASFALPENVREVKLAADPDGPDLYYIIGTLAQEPFELPFYVSTNDIFTITAGGPMTGSTFLRWDDGSKIISDAVTTAPINMSPYPLPPQLVTFTARYAATDSILTVTLASTPSGADLYYMVNGMTEILFGITPFIVSKSESLTIRAGDRSGYSFLRWEDDNNNTIEADSADDTIGHPDLSGYTGPAVTFTAIYVAPDERLTISLASDPGGAELFYTIGNQPQRPFELPFDVSIDDALTITAGDPLTGYTFLRWDDGSKMISSAATTAPIDLSSYPVSPEVVTFTARYAATDSILSVTLASFPTGADLFYKIDGLTEVKYGTTPFIITKSESFSINSEWTGYTFIRWDDGTKIISDAGPNASPILSDYTGRTAVTFTASFALPENVREVNLAADPVGPDLFYTIGTLAREPFELPFYVSTNDIFTIIAGDPLTGNTFLRWDDGSKVISPAATTAPINMSLYPLPPQIVTFTARYAAADSILTVTLTSFPTGADLLYKIDGLTEVKYGTTPFIVSKSESLAINSEWTGYTFIRWDDGTKIISDAGPEASPVLSDYAGRTTVTFTASFALPENVREVNLAADPVGPDLFYTIGALAREPFELPFYVSTNDIFTITAGDPLTGNTFLRWDDGSKIIASTATTAPINMSPYLLPPQLVTFTARYAATSSILSVTMVSFPTGASLSYNIGGLAWVQYGTTPFIVSNSESLTINSEWTGYTFIRWDDGTKKISDAGPEASPALSDYAGKTAVTFTARYALPGDVLEITLVSDPVGANLYYTIGSLAEVQFTTQIKVSKNESLAIRSDMAGSTFLRWDDGSKIISFAVSIASLPLSIYNGDVTFTANYAAIGNTLTVTLASLPTGATISYKIGSLIVAQPYNNTPFIVSKDESLTISSEWTGYTFLRWDDGTRIISDSAPTAAPDLSLYPIPPGAVTFTASYALPGDVLNVTIASAPADADLSYKIGSLAAETFEHPFNVSKGESLTITAGMAGSTFLRWDDGMRIITDTSATVMLNLNIYNGSVKFTANFAAAGSIMTIYLMSTPPGAVLSYTVGSLTEAQPYNVPFKVSRDEALAVRAGELSGYVFHRWQDNDLDPIDADPADSTVGHPDLSMYPGGSAIFTAVYVLSGDRWTLDLKSYPESSGTFEYRISGAPAWTFYTGPVPFATGDTVEVMPTPETGYTFRFWDDAAEDTVRTHVMSSDATLTAYFLTEEAGGRAAITLTADPDGAGTFTWSLPGMTSPNVYAGPFEVNMTDDLTINALAASGYAFRSWEDGTSDIPRNVGAQSGDAEHIASFIAASEPNYYFITATADSGSTISPNGSIAVQGGADKTFTFSAKPGYMITAVYVDGIEIYPSELASGGYTFYNVRSGHAIEVASTPAVTLTVEIVGGEGTAKYRIGASGQHVSFTGPQTVPMNSDIYVSIDAGKGYTFAGWTGDVESKDPELHFSDADKDIHLVAHLEAESTGGGDWAVLNLVFALLAIFTGAIGVIAGMDRWKKGNAERRSGTATILRLLALIIGLVSVIVFFLTENRGGSDVAVDGLTAPMFILFLVVLVLTMASFRFDGREGGAGGKG